MTINAVLDSEDQLETQTMNLDRVMKDLGGTGATVKVAILDCCRDNPFAKTKSWMRTRVLRELGEAEIPQTTLVCFATSAGRKAAALLRDNSKNSPFTQFLLDELPKPGQSLRTLFENVHDRLKEATAGRQEPTVTSDNALNELFRKTVLVRDSTPVGLAELSPPPTKPVLQVPPPAVDPRAELRRATKAAPFVNSLGMRFVPIPVTGRSTAEKNVLFCVWDTRVQDYETFAKATERMHEMPSFQQSQSDPAVNVSWDDAVAFCDWLSRKEERMYRLPSDHEWSCAVGIGEREPADGSPAAKDSKIESVYPWGTLWPPQTGAGNYSADLRVDHFPHTSPVGSFAANRYGLYDMGGNVWQWCQDCFDANKNSHVVRGGSWYSAAKAVLLSSYRGFGGPGGRYEVNGCCGFRCVLVIPHD